MKQSTNSESIIQKVKVQDGEKGNEYIKAGGVVIQDEKRSKIWNTHELMLLAVFLELNRDKFSSEQSKKQWKIFKRQSAFVVTKNVNQCRTYTHKLLRSFGSIVRINSFFRNSLNGYDENIATLKQRNEEVFSKIEYGESKNVQLESNVQIYRQSLQQRKEEKLKIRKNLLLISSRDTIPQGMNQGINLSQLWGTSGWTCPNQLWPFWFPFQGHTTSIYPLR